MDGVICITGDAVAILQNLSRRSLNSINIKTSEADIYNSMDKIARCGNFVCPGHDPNIDNFQTKDFPRIKDLMDDAIPLDYPELRQ
jgi:hypothetical protein